MSEIDNHPHGIFVGQNFVHTIGKKVRRFIHHYLIGGMTINLLGRTYITPCYKSKLVI